MSEKRSQQEYAELLQEWIDAEAVRQRLVDRLRASDEPLALTDPIWMAWDEADEMAGSAREAVRSFLAVSEHSARVMAAL